MKEAFVKYFEMLGMKEPIQNRIESILQKAQILFPDEDFVAVVVNDYVEKDGTRIFSHLRFYSKRVGFVAVEFIDKDVIDSIGYVSGKDLIGLKIKSENYDYVKAADNSRIFIETIPIYPQEPTAHLQGTGRNCDYLLDFARKYLVPRLWNGRQSS